MIRCLFTFVLVSILVLISYGSGPLSTPSISGKITSLSGEPVIGAHISVMNNITSTTSNIDGTFEIYHLKPGQYTLEITALGFKKIVYSVDILEEKNNTIQIQFEEEPILFPEIMIIGKSHKLFHRVPGSVSYISSSQLTSTNPLSGNDVLKQIPGIHIVEEEGMGMRLNMGLRGMDPDRSRGLLILEDGIPVALAPYGEPEMYYTPPIERMSGIEVLKGSGQILFGPQTIGGVVNYITGSPPQEKTMRLKTQFGPGGYVNGLFQMGNTLGKVGYHLTLIKKRADQIGNIRFDMTDLNAKLLFTANQNNTVAVKLGLYDETSNSTYVGLTQSMYETGGLDFTIMTPNDNLKVRRYHLSAVHDYRLRPQTTFKTTAFAYTTSRNWRRQDFSSNGIENKKPTNYSGVTWGDESVPNGAIYMRTSTGNRNRQFEVAGLESRMTTSYKTLAILHDLKIGGRILSEKALEQRINGSKPDAVSGELVENETRPGSAISIYAQQQTTLHPSFDVYYGIRMENFVQERHISRGKYNNRVMDTFITNQNRLHQWIPGFGFTWKARPNYVVFGGIHAGFAPPRTKDAISNLGEVYQLEAEKSVNTELGLRVQPYKGFHAEVTGFYMDFSNQIIPVSESSGGTGTGLVNGGQTFHRGIETSFEVNFADWLGLQKNKWIFQQSTTFVQAVFKGDRHIKGQILTGHSTPYAPRWTSHSFLEYESSSGLMAKISFHFIDKQFTDESNTIQPSADGRIGLLPAYFTIDGNVRYHIKKWNTTLFISGKNLTNERFMVSRRPQGIRVGLPSLVLIGFEWSL